MQQNLLKCFKLVYYIENIITKIKEHVAKYHNSTEFLQPLEIDYIYRPSFCNQESSFIKMPEQLSKALDKKLHFIPELSSVHISIQIPKGKNIPTSKKYTFVVDPLVASVMNLIWSSTINNTGITEDEIVSQLEYDKKTIQKILNRLGQPSCNILIQCDGKWIINNQFKYPRSQIIVTPVFLTYFS